MKKNVKTHEEKEYSGTVGHYEKTKSSNCRHRWTKIPSNDTDKILKRIIGNFFPNKGRAYSYRCKRDTEIQIEPLHFFL